MSMTSMTTGLPERGSTPVALLRDRIVRFHDGFHREHKILDAVSGTLDLCFQYLRAGDIGF